MLFLPRLRRKRFFSVYAFGHRHFFCWLDGGGDLAEYVSVDELAERVIRDMSQYSNEVVERSRAVAKTVRNEMKPKLEAVSPIRHYSTNTQVVKRIIVHRSPNVPRAIKQVKEEKYQPGYFKRGWAYGNIRLRDGREIYGVRNRNMPTVTHLLNFDHVLFAHKKLVGKVEGTSLVDDVQNWGARELERRLSEFLERE